MTDIPNLPVYSKNVLEMITVSNDYCLTISKPEGQEKSQLINYLQKVLPLLYLKGSLLPDIAVESPEANERFVNEEDWESLFNELRKKFGKDDVFWFIDNSNINLNEPVKGSLAESLTDIYQDLKDFILLYQKNSKAAKENAVFELKTSFLSHWGLKLVNAHRVLHYHLTRDIPDEPSDPYSNIF